MNGDPGVLERETRVGKRIRVLVFVCYCEPCVCVCLQGLDDRGRGNGGEVEEAG